MKIIKLDWIIDIVVIKLLIKNKNNETYEKEFKIEYNLNNKDLSKINFYVSEEYLQIRYLDLEHGLDDNIQTKLEKMIFNDINKQLDYFLLEDEVECELLSTEIWYYEDKYPNIIEAEIYEIKSANVNIDTTIHIDYFDLSSTSEYTYDDIDCPGYYEYITDLEYKKSSTIKTSTETIDYICLDNVDIDNVKEVEELIKANYKMRLEEEYSNFNYDYNEYDMVAEAFIDSFKLISIDIIKQKITMAETKQTIRFI